MIESCSTEVFFCLVIDEDEDEDVEESRREIVIEVGLLGVK